MRDQRPFPLASSLLISPSRPLSALRFASRSFGSLASGGKDPTMRCTFGTKPQRRRATALLPVKMIALLGQKQPSPQSRVFINSVREAAHGGFITNCVLG